VSLSLGVPPCRRPDLGIDLGSGNLEGLRWGAPVLLAAALAWMGGCSGKTAVPCSSGQISVGGECVKPCNTDGDCIPGEFCSSGVCRACSDASCLNGCWVGTSYVVNGSDCGAGQVCRGGSCRDECWISAFYYDSAATNPANACQSCQPATSTSGWTAVVDGAGCGAGRACSGGTCLPGCGIGTAYYGSAATNPANACQSCQPAASTSGWTNAIDGTNCGAGHVCSGGICLPGCWISASYYGSSATSPVNACQSCEPATSTSGWTDVVDGAGCGAGAVCNRGICLPGCWINASYYGSPATNPTNLCQSCQPSVSTSGWTSVTNGTSCGTLKACNAGACCDGAFGPKVDHATGTTPWSVAVGDFNRDGRPDLVVAGGSTVSVLLGNGNGTFAARVDYGTGSGASVVTVGDLDADAKPDLVVADQAANTVSVLLGHGNGTFAAKVDYATGARPFSVAVGDLNGDGGPDLAVANFDASTVSVLLASGNGTFAAKVDYATGTNARSAALGDFNGDGSLDVAVANWGANTVSVLLGNGDGTLGAKVDYPTGMNPISVVADVNGDAKPDLVVVNQGTNTGSVLLGNGDGTFAAKIDYATNANPDCVAVADFNGDGSPDLVVVNAAANTVSVLLGNGNGTFCAKVDYTGANPGFVAVADFNGDGRPDLAAANFAAKTVSVLLGTCIP
jgi:hypothetical protein